MMALDMEISFSEEKMRLIEEDDLFGYRNLPPYCLYTLARDGSGGGFHLWNDAVVFLGSEGERAKVGRSVEEFLQIVCSLGPSFPACLRYLPGMKALPNKNGNILGATCVDFDLEKYAKEEPSLDEDIKEVEAAAASMLNALELSKLSRREALQKLIDAHLAEPRFAIRGEGDE
jgi:hypothetical protein